MKFFKTKITNDILEQENLWLNGPKCCFESIEQGREKFATDPRFQNLRVEIISEF